MMASLQKQLPRLPGAAEANADVSSSSSSGSVTGESEPPSKLYSRSRLRPVKSREELRKRTDAESQSSPYSANKTTSSARYEGAKSYDAYPPSSLPVRVGDRSTRDRSAPSASSSRSASASSSPASTTTAIRTLRQRIAEVSSSPPRPVLRGRNINSQQDLRSAAEGMKGLTPDAKGHSLERKSEDRSRDASSPAPQKMSSSAQSVVEMEASPRADEPGDVTSESEDEISDCESGEEEHVVALHDFASNNSTCLSFMAGQVIKVYNRDESGWWDGELNGERGWFPSNYVDFGDQTSEMSFAAQESHGHVVPPRPQSEISTLKGLMASTSGSSRSSTPLAHNAMVNSSRNAHQSAQDSRAYQNQSYPVMQPIRHAIEVLTNAVRASRTSHFQPSTACVISSVRSVLASTDCLTRESATLKAHPELARERKHILAELSKLVTKARHCSSSSQNELPSEDKWKDMDEMLQYADRVFHHVRRFLEVAEECHVPIIDSANAATGNKEADAMPRSENVQDRSDQDKTPTPDSPQCSPLKTPRTPPRQSSANDIRASRASRNESGSSVSSMMKHAARLRQDDNPDSPPNLRRLSMTDISGSRTSVVDAHDEKSREQNAQRSDLPIGSSPSSVIARLDTANDHLLSVIAAFVGHIHAHSPDSHASSYAVLIDMTRATVDAVRGLLVIVEAVHDVDSLHTSIAAQMSILWETRESVYEATASLVTAARVMTASRQMLADSIDTGDDIAKAAATASRSDGANDKGKLLQSATAVLRTGGECVGAVKLCLQNASPGLSIWLSDGQNPGDSERQILSKDATGSTRGDIRRGNNTLSHLGRKATSLNCLRERYDGRESDRSPSHPFLELEEEDSEGIAQANRITGVGIEGLATTKNTKQASPIDGSDSSDDMSRQLSRASGSTTQSARSEMTNETSARPSLDRTPSTTADEPALKSAPIDGSFGLDKTDGQGSNARPRSASLPMAEEAVAPQRHPLLSAANRSVSEPLASRGISLESLVSADDHAAWEVSYNGEGQLTGATFSALIEKMTPHGSTIDGSLFTTFLLCFRLFATPMEVFRALEERYTMSAPPEIEKDGDALAQWTEHKLAPVRLRVFNLLKSWLDNHWNAASDYDVLEPIIEFTQTKMTHSLHRPGQRLAETAKKRLDAGRDAQAAIFATTATNTSGIVRGPGSLKRVVSSEHAPTLSGLTALSEMYTPASFPSKGPVLPPAPVVTKSLLNQLRSGATSKISVTDFDAMELARQLTVMESRIYCSILPDELLGQEFSKKSGVSGAVHVKSMSALSTHITGWVSECILREDDARKRTQIVKYFIKVGDRCLGLKNFNTLFAIQGALNSSTISRLKKTWTGLPAKYRILMEQQRSAVEHTRNFASYRQRLRTEMPPALPFVGLFLTDLTFCHEGNAHTRVSPNDPSKQLINFDKYVKMSRIIGELQRFQQPFTIVEVPEIQTYLLTTLDETQNSSQLQSADELYRRSLRLEPRTVGAAAGIEAVHSMVPPMPTRGKSLDLFSRKPSFTSQS